MREGTFAPYDGANWNSLYNTSFAGYGDGTRYVDYSMTLKGYGGAGKQGGASSAAIDLRRNIGKNFINMVKANSVSGLSSGTTDLSLIPIYVDPSIVDITRRLTPLIELVPRVTNFGRTADFNRVTARGIVGFRNEDAALAEADDTYERASVGIKFQYQVGRVTGPMLAASRQYLSTMYIDALNLEVRQKTINLRYSEEDALLNGNASSTRTAYGGVTTISGAEFNGIRNTSGLQSTAAGGVAPTIDTGNSSLRAIIRKARTANDSSTLGQGDPNLLVTDFNTMDTVKSLLQEFQRYIGTTDIAWGIRTIEFEGLPMIASKFMPTASTARELLVLQTDTLQMRVLQDVTYEELAKTNDSYKFMLKVYESLIVTAPQFNAKLTGLL